MVRVEMPPEGSCEASIGIGPEVGSPGDGRMTARQDGAAFPDGPLCVDEESASS